jgi:hypothetical protein
MLLWFNFFLSLILSSSPNINIYPPNFIPPLSDLTLALSYLYENPFFKVSSSILPHLF